MQEAPYTLVNNTQHIAILNLVPNPVYYVDANYIYKYANPEYERWLGVEEGSLTGKAIYDVMEEGTYDRISEHVAAALTGQKVEFETIIHLPFKNNVAVKTVYTPDIDNEGHVCGYLGMLYDVTGQTQVFDELKESESRYHQMIQGLDVAVYTCDIEGKITLFNNAAEQLWGRAPEIGQDLWCGSWKIYEADGSEMSLDSCPMAITLKTGQPVYNHPIIVECPDGSRRNILPHPRPMFNKKGEIVGAVNFLQDITDQVRAEQEIRNVEKEIRILNSSLEKKVLERTLDLEKKNLEFKESEEKYHRMIEEVEDYAIILMDKDGFIQNWNKGAEKIKGYTEQEILGKNFRIFYLPEDQQSGLPEKLITEAATIGRATHEGWRVTKTGNKFWGSIVITALHDDLNNITGFTKLTRNLTERKLAEDRLKQNAEMLELQNKELEQFAYIASHDMKEPLRKIILYNNMLCERITDKLDDKEKSYFERSQNAALRMQQLIEDLLAYSKTSFHTEESQELDLNYLLEDVTEFYREKLDEVNGEISIEKLPVVNGIGFQVRQLFDNLISNALKYRNVDRDPHIVVGYSKVAAGEINDLATMILEDDIVSEYHKVSISDNGIGFSKEYAQKIFELFQRLVTKDDYSGNGIGLSICRKIIQNHKGYIEAVSNGDKGATFNVYFPVKA